MKAKWLLAATLLAAAPAAPAAASQAPGAWFMGDWRCALDGRQTQMAWRNVSVDHGGRHGDIGTSVASVERRGRFLDRGAWSNLTFASATSTTLSFRHSDGNSWFLRRLSPTTARGNSTWNGRPYPLFCTKTR